MSAIAGAGTVTAAELDDPAVAELLQGERLRTVSLESRLLLAAARLALRDARGPGLDPEELGVVVATRHAGLQAYVDLYRSGTEGERPRVRPAKGPQAGLTAPAAEISIRLSAAGPNATVSNGAVGGLDALRYAADRLAAGDARAMLVCEVELAPAVMHAPGATGRADAATSSSAGADARTSRGAAANPPAERHPDTDPSAQRAAVLVLERADAARTSGAAPRVLVSAVATAFSPTGDAAEAQARAVAEALAGADADPDASDASAWNGGADGDHGSTPSATCDRGVIARLADAVANVARGEAAGPRLLRAHDDCSAGAAVVHAEPAGDAR